jgi:hypothetical protein
VTDECAAQRGSNAIEPGLRIAHELQIKVGWNTIVLTSQAYGRRCGSSLKFLPPTAAKSRTSASRGRSAGAFTRDRRAPRGTEEINRLVSTHHRSNSVAAYASL